MNKRKFLVYKCVAKKSDGSELIREFKIPSFWTYHTIVAALFLSSDSDGLIKEFSVENSELNISHKVNEDKKLKVKRKVLETLKDSNLKVTFTYEDDRKLVYECTKCNEELSNKTIVRKTPVLTNIVGYNRLTKEEYYKEHPKYIETAYEGSEELGVKWTKSDMTRLFTYIYDCLFK